MRALIPLCLLVLAGCLPETQPHHQPADPAQVAAVRAALVATIAGIEDANMPSERVIERWAGLYTDLARDAEPAYAAIAGGRLGPDQLQTFARAMVARMRERQGAEAQPPLVISALTARATLDQAEMLLLLGAVNHMATEGHLELSRTEREFLGRPVPGPPPEGR